MKLNHLRVVLGESVDWAQYSDEHLEFIARTFAVGPKYKPEPRKAYECGGCGEKKAHYQTFGSDTSHEETVLYCQDCGWTGNNR